MNCTDCQNQLLDLLYGELSQESEAGVRAHFMTCSSCKSAYERLEAGQNLASVLPTEAPSAALKSRVMAHAVRHANEIAAAPKVVRASDRPASSESRTIWVKIAQFLGGLAMRPQAAMATVFVVVAVIGLWSLPFLRESETATGETVAMAPQETARAPEAPSAAPVAVPSREPRNRESDLGLRRGEAPMEVAEAVTSDADDAEREPRAADGLQGGDAPPVPGRAQTEPSADPALAETGAVLRENEYEGMNAPSAPGLGNIAGERASGGGRVAASPATDMFEEFAGLDDTADRTEERASRSASASTSLSGAAEPAARARGAEQMARSPSTTSATPTAPAAAAPSPAVPPNNRSGAASSQVAQAAPQNYGYRPSSNSGSSSSMSASSGASGTQNQANVADAASLHARARALRAQGNTRLAISEYQRLLRLFPTYSARGQAMVELAALHRAVGDFNAAQNYITLAQRNAAPRASVEQEQNALNRQRASSGPGSAAAARRAAPAPMPADEAAASESAY